jgi:hypothetical protein
MWNGPQYIGFGEIEKIARIHDLCVRMIATCIHDRWDAIQISFTSEIGHTSNQILFR